MLHDITITTTIWRSYKTSDRVDAYFRSNESGFNS